MEAGVKYIYMSEGENWNRKVDHPLQSWEWGEFRRRRQEIDRQDGMLVMWTKIKYSPWCFGYIPMGKIPTKEEVGRLRELGRRRKAVGIRMEPNVSVDGVADWQAQTLGELLPGRKLFKTKTFFLDLGLSEVELLKKMHPKARYNIKVAQKHQVKVEMDDGSRIEDYLELMFGGTASRQGIYSHSPDYHRQLFENLHPSGVADLWVAKYQGKILAANIVFRFKDKIYYAYGATALEHREVMAPTLLLWEIARWGKKAGYKIFDLWGAEEGTGFTRFKEQFGGRIVETVGSYDLPVNNLLYPGFRMVEKLRWKLLRLWK